MERNLTTGGVFRNIVSFSLPYLLSYFLQTLYGMADLFITGQFRGVADITAVAIGSQVMHMLTVMIVGLAMGSTVTIGRAVGAGDRGRAACAIGNTITLFMVLSFVLTAALLACSDKIVAVMSTPTGAAAGTEAYLKICFAGIPFITAYNIISSIFRGLGDTKSPMYFIASACAVNVALDYILIGGLGMGPEGAALATTLSQASSVALALFFIMRHKSGISVSRGDLRPKRSVMGQILKIGVPITLQDGFIQISFIIITIIVNMRGLADAAAVGIVEKIISFLFLVPSSMLSAVAALGAQNLGAGKPERARLTLRYAAMIAVAFGAAVAVLMQFAAEPAVALFTDPANPGSAEVVSLGGQYMRGYVWDCIFAGVHFCFSGYFCACGRSGISFLHNAVSIILVRVPGVYLTSKLFADTLFPMGLATTAGSLLSVAICVAAYAIITRNEEGAHG